MTAARLQGGVERSQDKVLQNALQFCCWVYKKPCCFVVAGGQKVSKSKQKTLQFCCCGSTRVAKNLAVLLLQDKDLQNTLQFFVAGGQRFKKTAVLLLEEDMGLQNNHAVLLLEGLQTPCMSFVVGRGQGFTQNLAVKAGRVAGRSGKRLEE